MSNYALSKTHAPIYNAEGGLEFIAFPETKFTRIKKKLTCVQVTTREYPSEIPLFVDLHFLEEAELEPPERQKKLPAAEEVLSLMESLVGTPYLWGGNWAEGIPGLGLKGVDCSGLLFQATNGFTPRNTSELVNYGKVISSPSQIKPLDMLVWKGHVVFVLNSKQTIESLSGKGVIILPLEERYLQVCKKTQVENKTLFIRRWHPDLG